jgi:hypothetical protein
MHFLCGNNAPKMITIYPEKHCALTMLYPNIVPEARFDKNRISNKNFAYPAGGVQESNFYLLLLSILLT